MRHLVAQARLQDAIGLDSAGTGSWHVGHAPDERATAAARDRGIALAGAARQVEPEDFGRFDLLVAMDESNRRDLLALAPDAAARGRVVLLREFDPLAGAADDRDVPDPYLGGDDGFAHVYDVVERACRGLLEHLREQAGTVG